jgi:phosphate transport system permease protein
MTTLSIEENDVRLAEPPQKMPTRTRIGDRLFYGALSAAALLPPLLILVFLIVLAYGAWPAIEEFRWHFLVSSAWNPNPGNEQYGALPFLLGTVISSILALVLAAPIGICVATFISEVLPGSLRGLARFLVEILATIPSVVYGLWGVFVLAPFVMNHIAPPLTKTLGFLPFFAEPIEPRNIMCAILILAIMVLPMIVSVSLDSMRMVPVTYSEAALGLGATRWEMIRIGVWPSSRSGFVGGCILALGRALGETMAVTMVIGNGHHVVKSLFAASDTVASSIANQFAEAPSDLFTAALIELALLLFIITLAVNLIARLIVRRVTPAGVAD